MDIAKIMVISVCIIYSFSENIQKNATGFFYGGETGHIHLVTNKHVLFSGDSLFSDKIFLKLHKRGDLFNEFGFLQVDLLDKNENPNYYLHDSSNIDLVIIKIDTIELNKKFQIGFITESIILPQELIYPIGSDVFILGYPLGFYDTISSNSPIAMSSKLSTNKDSKFWDKEIFLLDGNFNGGLSGSPVFTKFSTTYNIKDGIQMYPENRAYLIGIFSAQYYRENTYTNDKLTLGIAWHPNYLKQIWSKVK